jgi:hypothetical protein
MRELIARVPADVFWALLCGWVLGVMTAWRFTSLLERMKDAVRHAKYHWERGKTFVTYVKDNVKGLVMAAGALLLVTGVVGYIAYLRLSG